jgi:hypothetical protein
MRGVKITVPQQVGRGFEIIELPLNGPEAIPAALINRITNH